MRHVRMPLPKRPRFDATMYHAVNLRKSFVPAG
jgi:hypothetical protein